MASRIKTVVSKYERHLSAAALLIGFIFDNLTLQRIDSFWGYISLVIYLAIATFGMAVLIVHESGRLRGSFFDRIAHFLPIVIQFVFGGLFSGFLVYYFRSATVSVNWPFILALLLLLVGNEVFRKYYKRMVFNLGMLSFCVMSFAIFYVPIAVGRIGDDIFALSGFASLAFMALFIFALSLLASKRMREIRMAVIVSILSIYSLVTVFYFINVIPPIPLSMKTAGVYRSLVRQDGNYVAQSEKLTGFARFLRDLRVRQTVHTPGGERTYFYSAVFAPTNLTTPIVHIWQRYNEVSEVWVTRSKVEFPIFGGREDGYRGYSYVSDPEPGRWRVRVETPQGRVIGIYRFAVERSAEMPELQKIEL